MKQFETPEVIVKELEICDVITTSVNTGEGGTPPVNPF